MFRSCQIVFQNLARKGFVVFAWDPPGRAKGFSTPFMAPTVPDWAQRASMGSSVGRPFSSGRPQPSSKSGTRFARSSTWIPDAKWI